MTRDELCAYWAARREELARTDAYVKGARIIEQFLTDVAAVEDSAQNAVLSLKEAAIRSGYSAEHLARLIRQGRVSNAGRRFAPRIRVADLPKRRSLARNDSGSYNVDTDARTLRNGRQ